ncbi:hypothetical protein ACFPER_02605 [Agromyces aurantiacus]|uniref:PKD domain-containing protein n=1 Tax=Agromyces aurantiacus TaxID=165814 RepID=A0ABV9R2K9_9MICO|nr:hypothetical protein [Agromyces aurantiacus]MBM7505979.1 hypothetical protein [Agromyces aurantiacus]
MSTDEVQLEAGYESVSSGPKTANNDPADGYTPELVGDENASSAERPTAPPSDICSPTNPTECAFTGAEPEPPAAGEPTVTLRDIASFRPVAPETAMQPDGWAVVGLPANFVTEAAVQTRAGTLLGRSAEVRFHPVGYRWTHSDGSVVQASVPGARWEELGQAEFSETATSHSYAESGEYTVGLSVVFVVEYRFDGSAWRWIDGTLVVLGAPREVLVGEFDTVLVTGDCTVAPNGPGC